MVAYNIQVALDAKHHLIVAHEVINQGHDRSALACIALAARKAMGKRKLQAIADRRVSTSGLRGQHRWNTH